MSEDNADQPVAVTESKEIAQTYKPSDKEVETIRAYFEKKKQAPLGSSLKLTRDEAGADSWGTAHEDKDTGTLLLHASLGSTDTEFTRGILNQAINVGDSEADTNFVLSVVRNVEPRDELETMLATQMAAIHLATMTFARRLSHVENIAQQDSAEKTLNKLARTFTTLVEALKRYRTGGQQKVTVEHVTVNSGGQAIVGNVEGGGGQEKGEAIS